MNFNKINISSQQTGKVSGMAVASAAVFNFVQLTGSNA
jgi:hypothetical protein